MGIRTGPGVAGDDLGPGRHPVRGQAAAVRHNCGVGEDSAPLPQDIDGLPARRRLGRYLRGAGLDVGPGRAPYRPPGLEITTVDRWHAAEATALWGDDGHAEEPEGAAGGDFSEPDVVADLDTDRLAAFVDASQDFVIASHVVEHLADPIGFLDEAHRVLRPGGLALLFLPDRHRTKDRFRAPTPVGHVVADYRARVAQVSDAHLEEFGRDRGIALPRRAAPRAAAFEQLRRQSVHVHCWSAEEFLAVLGWGIEHLGHQWELVEGCLYEPPVHFEFGLLLRRAATTEPAAVRARRFTDSCDTWLAEEQARRPGITAPPRSALPPWAHRRARRLRRRYPALWRALAGWAATLRTVVGRARRGA